jgi:hypothetical protein
MILCVTYGDHPRNRNGRLSLVGAFEEMFDETHTNIQSRNYINSDRSSALHEDPGWETSEVQDLAG